MFPIYYIFIINLLLLIFSCIIFKTNAVRLLLCVFILYMFYFIYVLFYINLNLMFEFFFYGWSYVIVYSFLIITFISFIFTLIYFNKHIFHYIFFILLIFFSAYQLISANNILIFFISYELLLIPAFYILYKFAKTYRCVEAAYVMLFWTQLGAMFLIFLNIYIFIKYNTLFFLELNYISLNCVEQKLIFIILLISFGVKMPIWPFHLWLPKAHVEAPTNFSIFLSGVLVKLAFFAFIKFIFSFQILISYWFINVWLILGIFDVSMRIFYQIDLKKIIAFTTIIEMHWLLLVLLQSNFITYISAILMMISHAIISSLFFLLTDSISRRFHTRIITEISSIWLYTPWLTSIILITNIIFLGFPCTSLFWAEMLLFMYLIEINPLLCGFMLILLFLLIPIILFKFWIQIMYGNFFFIKIKLKLYYDVNRIELLIYSFLLLHLIIIGICPLLILG